MKDILKENKGYIFMGRSEEFFEDLDLDIFSTQWIKKIEKLKIKGKLLCSENQKLKVAKTEEYKLLPEELISEISTWTYGNKSAIFILTKPPYVVLINSKSVADSNRKTFEHLWKIAKRPTKKHLKKTKI